MAQFPGFAPAGGRSFDNAAAEDVGMTDADDESNAANSALTRTMDRFRSALKISPPKLSIPNPIRNYFAVSAAVDPTFTAPPGFAGDGTGDSSSASNAANSESSQALPITPVYVPPSDQFPDAPVTVVSPTFPAPTVPFAAPAIPEPKPSKPQARNKVPLERGYSQMVWLKLVRTQADIAGLNGASPSRPLSMEEVKMHRSEGEAWTVLKGRVYNITPYLKFHPGGSQILMTAAGIDGTALFNKHHSWVNAEFLLEKCQVGLLDQGQGSASN